MLAPRALAPGLLLLAACSRRDPYPSDVPPPSSVVVVGSSVPSSPPPVTASAPPVESSPPPVASAPGGDDEEEPGDGEAPTPAASGSAEGEAPLAPEFTPTEGGEHRLAAIAREAWVYAGPNDETTKLGYLRAGAVVDRGEKPVASTKRCKGGWYRVLPRGYVCNGKRATIDLQHPVVVASWRRPARGEPLPYKYGRSREVPPYLYHRVPTPREMERAELIRFKEQVQIYPKSRFAPLVGEPEPLPPFLASGRSLIKPFGVTQRLHVGPHEGKATPGSAFAFMSIHEVEGRLFGLSTDLNLVPLDRLDLAKLTDIHGGEIDDLPAGLIVQAGAPRFQVGADNVPRKDGVLERFQAVSFTGQTRGELWETKGGFWVSTQGMKLFKKRDAWPSFLKPDSTAKWIDVSIQHQVLIAYEGTRAVYVTQVSTGLAEMADPETTTATKRGSFSVKSKHVSTIMTGQQQVEDYELSDVPYVQYFEGSYALHAAYWHEKFGRPRSHGCVNLPPRDAAWLFEWTEPQVPKEWHGALAHGGTGTIVHVRY